MHDAHAARESFDRLMDDIERAPFGEGEVDARLARAKTALATLVEATKVVSEGGLGTGVLPQVIELERARIELEVASAVHDAARLQACLARLDAALTVLTQTQPPAPLLEVRGLWTRGRILAALGDRAGARAHFREVIEVLEPHVAEQERLRNEGDEATRAALEVTDRRVHAATVLAAAQDELDFLPTDEARAPEPMQSKAPARGGRIVGVLTLLGGVGLLLLALALPMMVALWLVATGNLDAGWYEDWVGTSRMVLGLAGLALCAWGWARVSAR